MLDVPSQEADFGVKPRSSRVCERVTTVGPNMVRSRGAEATTIPGPTSVRVTASRTLYIEKCVLRALYQQERED
jgi:hypothetical protein